MSELRRLFDLVCDLPHDERAAALRIHGADDAAIEKVLSLFVAEATRTRARAPLASLVSELAGTELDEGAVLGAWRLVREIGRGGMGAVFLAERADGHFEQRAAVKLIHGRSDPAAAVRFAHERQLLAGLQHPQIARLLDGGATPEGQPYLVMEYIEGTSIDRWCRETDADLEARLALLASICAAVQYAHQRLVVHCDLKPSNVLVRADGVPVLLDFGIARALETGADARSGHTIDSSTKPGADDAAAMHADAGSPTPGNSADTPMTPRYASPEQLRGETPGLATDIFALGLILFELVSDKQPPRDRNAGMPRPSDTTAAVSWKTHLRGDLDAIVARACAADPNQRYVSAAELAEDVGHFLARRPVRARGHRPGYVFLRLLQRQWPMFALLALTIVLAAGFTWRTVLAERRARIEADSAKQATDFLVSVFATQDNDVTVGALHELTARDVLDTGRARIATELADQPAVRARLLEALGQSYRHMELTALAAPLLSEAADLNLSPSVDDREAAARCLEALTNAMANGDFEAAEVEQVALRSIELARAMFADDSQEVANAQMVLSLAYNRNGKYELAQAAAETSLAINQSRRGQPDNRLPVAHHNLGLILSNRGEQAQARTEAQRGIELGDPASVGGSIRERVLSVILQRRGEWSAALEQSDAALATVTRLGGDHSALATDYRLRRARLLLDAGRYAESDGVYARAAADHRALNADDSDEALGLRQELADARVARGEIDGAVDELAAVHAARLDRYGDDDPRTWSAAAAWSNAQIVAGVSDQATGDRIQDAITRWLQRSASGSNSSRQAQLLLTRWQLDHGDVDAAERVLHALERDVERLEARFRPGLVALRAALMRARGDNAAALRFEEAAWTEHRRVFGDQHPMTVRAALLLACHLRRHSEADRAATLEAQWRARLEEFPPGSIYRQPPSCAS